jgi:hypothetical protein
MRFHGFPLLLALSTAFAASTGCGSSSGGSSGSGPSDGGSDSGAGAGPVARFDLTTSPTPAYMAVPFPSDIYLQGGKVNVPGADAIVKENATFITSELAKMNGFSRIAFAQFYVDDLSKAKDPDGNPAAAALDPKSLPADEASCVADTSSAFLVDLDATDPSKARVTCRAVLHQDYKLSTSRTYPAVGPAAGIVLAPGHHYAAVLTSRVKTTDGKSIGASADFTKVQQAASGAPSLYVDAYKKVTTALSSALAKDGATVVAIAPFTTHDLAKQLFTLRDGIEAAAAPALKWDATSMSPMSPAVFAAPGTGGTLPQGAKASLDDWLGVATKKLSDGTDDPDGTLPVVAHDQIAAVGTGVFDAVNWLTHYQGANYQVAGTAQFSTDASGNIVPAPDAPTDKIWVSFAVPKAKMPSGGYPLVIFQHGLSGSRDDFLTIANPLCKQGWMVAAIDSITFGARAPEASYQVDKTSDFSASPGAKYTGPDGFADAIMGTHNGSFDLFGSLLDLGAVRDQLRQAALDTVQLVHVLRSGPDLSGLSLGGAAPKIDASRVAYLGQSLGSIEGAVAAALEPNVNLWALNVAGGGLIIELGANGPLVGLQVAEAAGLNFAFVQGTFDPSHLIDTLIQTAIEPGDPLDYASYIVLDPQPAAGQPTKPRNVLQTEVIYDEWVPNESNEALARAGGWGLAQPNLGSNSGIYDLSNIMANTGRLPLESVAQQADGTIHDTPMQGVTAVVVQSSPATHGDNLTSSAGQRNYCIPYANYAGGQVFQMLSAPLTTPNPYLQTQAAVVQFFSDGFQGKVPGVVVPQPAPVRDPKDPPPCGG